MRPVWVWLFSLLGSSFLFVACLGSSDDAVTIPADVTSTAGELPYPLYFPNADYTYTSIKTIVPQSEFLDGLELEEYTTPIVEIRLSKFSADISAVIREYKATAYSMDSSVLANESLVPLTVGDLEAKIGPGRLEPADGVWAFDCVSPGLIAAVIAGTAVEIRACADQEDLVSMLLALSPVPGGHQSLAAPRLFDLEEIRERAIFKLMLPDLDMDAWVAVPAEVRTDEIGTVYLFSQVFTNEAEGTSLAVVERRGSSAELFSGSIALPGGSPVTLENGRDALLSCEDLACTLEFVVADTLVVLTLEGSALPDILLGIAAAM